MMNGMIVQVDRRGYLISILSLFILFFSTISCWGQTRSLGFRGMVPPAKAKKYKYKIQVDALDLPLINARDDDGNPVRVFIGPSFFLREEGFVVREGQRLLIKAVPMKVEGKSVLVGFVIRDRDTGKEISLRDKRGEPLWWKGSDRGSGKKR